ncbi:hypothetical protein [Mycolicibacterium thermoresistibile]
MTSLLSRSTTAPRRVRVGALDTQHSRRHSALVVGPLRMPSVDVLTERFDAMAAVGPVARLGLQPSTSTTRWPLATALTGAVTVAEPIGAEGDPVELLAQVNARPRDGIAVLAAGDHLAIRFSHGLGEVGLIHTLIDVLLGCVDPRDEHTWQRYRGGRSPLLAATLRTFVADPRRAARLLAFQRGRSRPPAAGMPDPTTGPIAADPATRAAGLSADAVAEVRALRDATLPGVSLVAIFTHALWLALRDAGADVDPTVKIPFDVRRYLPPGRDTLASFSAGLDFRLDPQAGPERLQAEMDQATRTGRPVANLILGTVKARKAARASDVTPTRSRRLHLLHSNIGNAPRTDRWPFTDHSRARVLVASDPVGVSGITVTSASTSGNLWLTAQFHRSAVHPEVVGAALATVGDRAVTLLRGGPQGRR